MSIHAVMQFANMLKARRKVVFETEVRPTEKTMQQQMTGTDITQCSH